jgi:hypothetical protein
MGEMPEQPPHGSGESSFDLPDNHLHEYVTIAIKVRQNIEW